MCGLFGWQFLPEQKPEGLTVLSSFVSIGMETRGRDSWGVALPDGTLIKALGRISRADIREFYDQLQVVGHTRHATVGAVTVPNAHPFRFGDVIGAHNGAVYNHKELNDKLNTSERLEVDSMHIFHQLSKSENLEEPDLSMINSYGAITYFDAKNPGKVYAARFNAGQLVAYGLPERKGVIWSSTEDAIETAIHLIGYKGKVVKYTIEEGKLFYFEDGDCFTNNFRLKIGTRPTTTYTTGWSSLDSSVYSYGGGTAKYGNTTYPTNHGASCVCVDCTKSRWEGSTAYKYEEERKRKEKEYAEEFEGGNSDKGDFQGEGKAETTIGKPGAETAFSVKENAQSAGSGAGSLLKKDHGNRPASKAAQRAAKSAAYLREAAKRAEKELTRRGVVV